MTDIDLYKHQIRLLPVSVLMLAAAEHLERTVDKNDPKSLQDPNVVAIIEAVRIRSRLATVQALLNRAHLLEPEALKLLVKGKAWEDAKPTAGG